ncbi:hypothetical protein [Actinocrispum wychmicini]|uniref:Uncharacterized protein n=1 Tax=Actinocrispum wychmicini TaxID=1213861 RepID=A0A4V2S6D7_9PSEU|nr:hypothetical protein [Actinocrispum wychmicini]TCO55660.1 hypothetical protein EV192_10782 [Actinocrispum wychmicini]
MSADANSLGKDTDVADEVKVRDLVRDVVAEVASEELPVVDGLARFDDRVVVRRLGRRSRRREPLGFGPADLVTFVTAVVWLVLDQAAKKAAGSAVDGAVKGGKAGLRKVFRRRSAPVLLPSMTSEQLAELWQLMFAAAVQRGLDEEQATTIADVVVARLSLPRQGGDKRGLSDGSDGSGTPT